MRTELLESVLHHEGFKSKPYQDTLGVWTFGHGLTYITEDESRAIVERRLKDNEDYLDHNIPVWYKYPEPVKDILIEMAYQMGAYGLLHFKMMLSYIDAKDYKQAAIEGLDSAWAKQTPNRAKELMDKLAAV